MRVTLPRSRAPKRVTSSRTTRAASPPASFAFVSVRTRRDFDFRSLAAMSRHHRRSVAVSLENVNAPRLAMRALAMIDVLDSATHASGIDGARMRFEEFQ